MAFTTHGHQIAGTPVEKPQPDVVSCGGPRLCGVCSKDVARWALNNNHPLAFKTDNGGVPDAPLIRAKQLVFEKYNNDIAEVDLISLDEIFVVWYSYTLGNWKALLSTDRSDARYYEVTYNARKAEHYVDVYVKESNDVVPITD